MKEEKRYGIAGITLIALVITIIILLILAGITINALLGENGLITKAQKAFDATKIGEYTERINLITTEEISKRAINPKEEPLIKSLKETIEQQTWVQDVLMTDENGVEQTDFTKGTHLIVETTDGYELIVEVNNTELWAEIVEGGKSNKKKYEVTYVEEGNKETVEVRQGFSIILKKCSVTKTGYKFIGWRESKTGEGKIYTEGSLYKPTKNTTLYAIFEQITVTLHFDANQGTGSIEDIAVKPGQSITIPQNNSITRIGFIFKGWNIKQDGTGSSYANNSSITITENTTLYAMWEENLTATINITNNKKLTEGTTISLGATALGTGIQKIELKSGSAILYTKNNIGTTTYSENNMALTNLNNLGQVAFYDDIIITLEVTSKTGAKKQVNLNQVKNYTVSSPAQLNKLAIVVNNGNTLERETVIQLADININGENYTVIGTQTNAFGGTYNGNNKTVSGIYINNSLDYQGLFGKNDGTIKNLGVINSNITGNSSVGGIVGYNSGKIINCYNTSTIVAKCIVAGIAGYNRGGGSIENCHNEGNITSTGKTGPEASEYSYTGGITGSCSDDGNNTLTNCYNVGTIMGSYPVIGGICGANNGNTVSYCYNKGHVKGVQEGSSIGGIAGWNRGGGIVELSYNEGFIECTGSFLGENKNLLGGIVGYSYGADNVVQNTYNIGTIEGNSVTGAIIGESGSAQISNNYYLSGTIIVGGISQNIGNGEKENSGTISKSYSYFAYNSNNTSSVTYLLNGNKETGIWSRQDDMNFGYPILTWQLNV